MSGRERRVRILPLHGLRCQWKSPEGTLLLGLTNISTTGAGILVPTDSPMTPKSGDKLSGEFLVGSDRVAFESVVVHHTGRVVGVRYTAGEAAVKSMLMRHLELELKAHAMVEVNREMLKPETDGAPRWFKAANGFELYLVSAPSGEIAYFHLVFLGNYFEAGRGKGLRYGSVVEDVGQGKPKYTGSEVIRYHSTIPVEIRASAVRIIESVPELDPGLRAELCLRFAH